MGKNKNTSIISLLSSIPALTRLLASLFIVWLTLGWKVRKARKAFEKELRKQGMSKQDAKRISSRYAALKDQAMDAFKRSFRIFP